MAFPERRQIAESARKAQRKLNSLMTQLSLNRGTATDLRIERAYFDKLLGKLER